MTTGIQAVTMQAHNRTETAPLEPTDQQFSKFFAFGVTAMEPTAIHGPPGNTCHSHGKTNAQLRLHCTETGINVTAPYQRPILLTAGPGAPHQIDNLFLPFLFHAVVKGLGIHHRVQIAHLQVGTQMIPVIGIIIDRIFRLCFIQPENTNAQVIIILFGLPPNKIPGTRMCGIIKHRVTHKVHGMP